MNEDIISKDNRDNMCETKQRFQRTGRIQRCFNSRRYFQQQRIGQYACGGGVSSTLMARDYKSASDLIVEPSQKRVRRLTPIECLRLQGLPDWWCDEVKGSDSAIYKMAGNGIAVLCAIDVLGRIADEAEDL